MHVNKIYVYRGKGYAREERKKKDRKSEKEREKNRELAVRSGIITGVRTNARAPDTTTALYVQSSPCNSGEPDGCSPTTISHTVCAAVSGTIAVRFSEELNTNFIF